ncbi:MAG: hypothetical protein COA78_32680 [Blastopirellula sp.]|nr:MAG: hypothetical protein COA78_32680 [Blastopirellula sp.]
MTGHPLAIAHRGACDYAPENTLKSFQIAADLCAEMWELDIRISADGVCVVAHDDDLTRVAQRGFCVSQTTWDEISTVQLPEGQQIPRLEQVIELAKETGCGLYIEVKSERAGPLAWELLKDADFNFAVLASFNVSLIRELREMGCAYPLGILVPVGADPLTYLGGVDVDVVHLCWRYASENPHELLTDDLMQEFTDHGHQVVIWDEDRAKVLDALWNQPIMGICSNRPELLKPYRPNPDQPVDIVCHRGANKLAPENTLDAARICIDQRFQFVELDVRTTADGELIVIHDADITRTTNGGGLVIDMTLSEIRSLDAGTWFREGSAGVRVPTLSQMLDLVKDRAGLYIEVKHADPAMLLQVIIARNMLDKCFFWGYDSEVLSQLRTLSPEATIMSPRWMYSSLKEAATTHGVQIVEFDPAKDNLYEISQCRDLGVKSMIYSLTQDWTELASYLQIKPDMVNLDHPDRFKILTTYPKVRRHFETMQRTRINGA